MVVVGGGGGLWWRLVEEIHTVQPDFRVLAGWDFVEILRNCAWLGLRGFGCDTGGSGWDNVAFLVGITELPFRNS